MKIVVLDGYGLNPGDLSWNGMEALGELTVYDRTAPDELMERSSGAEVLITNKTVITAENMAALPALKSIIFSPKKSFRIRYTWTFRPG